MLAKVTAAMALPGLPGLSGVICVDGVYLGGVDRPRPTASTLAKCDLGHSRRALSQVFLLRDGVGPG